MAWDVAGDLMFRGQPVSEQTVFSQCSALVYVIDAQDEPYQVMSVVSWVHYHCYCY